MSMSELNIYKWEDIRKYFPLERVAEFRAKILELRKSGKYTDEELWNMYGMSERTFYDKAEIIADVIPYSEDNKIKIERDRT